MISVKKKSATSIRSFLLQRTFIYSVLGFLVLVSVTHYAFTKSVAQNASAMAERVAKQTFNSMYLVMSQGWSREQLEQFVHQMEKDNRDSDLRVTIFRGDLVTKKFGEMASPAMSDTHRKVLSSGESQLVTNEDSVSYFYALNAKEVCTHCHTNVEDGDTLGMIEVTQELDHSLLNANKELILTLILVSPLPLLLAVFATRQSIDKSAR